MECSMNKTIGFIGIGVMGKSMARNLMQEGYHVQIFTRTKEKASDLVEQGAIWKNSVTALSTSSDIIISIVGYPSDVEEIYFGENGIIQNASTDTYIIDMTTSNPKLAKRIAEAAEEKGLHALDAPVSGGDIGARNGSLAIMVGGKQKDFDAMLPIFEIMGENIVLQGPAGAGQHTKMANQITIASNMIGVTEAIMYAKKKLD